MIQMAKVTSGPEYSGDINVPVYTVTMQLTAEEDVQAIYLPLAELADKLMVGDTVYVNQIFNLSNIYLILGKYTANDTDLAAGDCALKARDGLAYLGDYDVSDPDKIMGYDTASSALSKLEDAVSALADRVDILQGGSGIKAIVTALMSGFRSGRPLKGLRGKEEA